MYTYDHSSLKGTPLIKGKADVQALWCDTALRFPPTRSNYKISLYFSLPVQAEPPSVLCAEWVSCPGSMEDGEKEDPAREEQARALWAEATKKKKQRRGQKVEKPEAFMANFFKGLEIYQTKLLVSAPALASLLVQELPRQTSEKWPQLSIHLLVSYASSLSHSPSFPLLIYLPVPFVLEEEKKRIAWKSRVLQLPCPAVGTLSDLLCSLGERESLFLAGPTCVCYVGSKFEVVG